jgi:two-component system, NtrC family, response regulator HydG
MNRKLLLAVADDEAAQRRLLRDALESAGYAVRECANGEEALAAADAAQLMLLDVRMPGLSGLEVLEKIRKSHPKLPVILLTAYIDVRDAVHAIRQGAADYLEKPVDLDELITVIDETLGVKEDRAGMLPLPEGVIAESEAMRRIFQQALRVAETDSTVLLSGESGSGKEVIAGAIHQASSRADRPMVVLNCAAVPAELLESELFGHVKGAFTGAETPREGRFAEADGGTLFLDEIGELPVQLQPKLLRVLETGVFRPVGGDREKKVDTRVIAATNRDLRAETDAGGFREDLYYRLNVFPIEVPPLRERREDILPLADHFLHATRKRLSPAAQRRILAHHWPGNVRELRNALERAAILSDGNLILPEHLPPALEKPETPQHGEGNAGGEGQPETMEEIQKRAILDALEKTEGNKTRAAEMLGISRRNLIYKLRSWGM